MRSFELAKRNFKGMWRDWLSLGVNVALPVTLLLVLQALESVDDFFETGSEECLLYITEDERVLTWPFPDYVTVRKVDQYLFANLSKVANYSEMYDQLNLSLYHSLSS